MALAPWGSNAGRSRETSEPRDGQRYLHREATGGLCINAPATSQASLAAMHITASALPSNLIPPGLSRREAVQVWQPVASGRSQQIPCFSDYLSQNFHLLGKNHPDPTRWSRHPLISGTSRQGTRNCTSSGHPLGPPGTCRHLLIPVTSVHGYQLKTVLSGCRKTNTQITQSPTPHPTDTPAIL